jgi:NCS1 family nucleobase:cation symporter-1
LTVLSTLPSSEASLYSAGLALTNVFPKQARWKNTVIVTACGIVLAVFGIAEHLGDFLTSLSYVFSPLVGVSLCDYFLLRRCRLDLEEAYQDKTKGKRFWNRGVNGAAIVAILAGIAVSAAAASRFPAALTGLFVGAIAYYAIERHLRFKNSTSMAI